MFCNRTTQVSTCVVEGDCFLICADFISSLAAVVPSILWGYFLNDERSLGIHVDSGVVPEKHMTYGGSIAIINIKLISLVSLVNGTQTLPGFSGSVIFNPQGSSSRSEHLTTQATLHSIGP